MTLPAASPIPRHERETTLTWLDTDATISLYTSSLRMARKLVRQGYTLTPKHHHNGQPTGWTAALPLKNLTLRRMKG